MKNDVCWIEVVNDADADESLKTVYDGVRGKNGQLDNLYQGFSLRPHTIKPADDLYLAAMHNDDNTLPKQFSELIGTYVAMLTGCTYAETHHGHNYRYLTNDSNHSQRVIDSLKSNQLHECGNDREVAALVYVKKLVQEPHAIAPEQVSALREAGWGDGEILEIVQVVAMFSYFVRVINGVGIQLGDEKPGLY